MPTTFPQANNMDLLYKILVSFDPFGESYTTISEKEKIHSREGSYYLSALEFMGFIEKRGKEYCLSPEGLLVYNASNDIQRIARFTAIFFENPVLSDLYQKGLEYKNDSERKEFFSKYIQHNFGLLESTAQRRASTISSWFSWFDSHFCFFRG